MEAHLNTENEMDIKLIEEIINNDDEVRIYSRRLGLGGGGAVGWWWWVVVCGVVSWK